MAQWLPAYMFSQTPGFRYCLSNTTPIYDVGQCLNYPNTVSSSIKVSKLVSYHNNIWWLNLYKLYEKPSICLKVGNHFTVNDLWMPSDVARATQYLRLHMTEEYKQSQLLILLLINEKSPKTGHLIATGGMAGSELRFLLCFYSALCLRTSLLNGFSLALHQTNVQKRPRWAEQLDPALHHCPSSMHNTVPQKDGTLLSKFPIRLHQESMHFLVNCCKLANWTSFSQCDEPLLCT